MPYDVIHCLANHIDRVPRWGYDSYMNSMNERHDALATIIAAHASRELAAETIIDYHDDPAAISSPTLIEALEVITDETSHEFLDITATLEAIEEIDRDLAELLAQRAELCIEHACDIAICADEH